MPQEYRKRRKSLAYVAASGARRRVDGEPANSAGVERTVVAGWLTLLEGRPRGASPCSSSAGSSPRRSATRRRSGASYSSPAWRRCSRAVTTAQALLRQALAAHHAAGDDDGEWLTLYQLALVSSYFEDHAQAIAYGERSLEICRSHDEAWAEAHALWVTEIADPWCGETERAGGFREALRIKHELGDRWGITRCMEALAWTRAPSRPEEAARLPPGRLWRMTRADLGAGRWHDRLRRRQEVRKRIRPRRRHPVDIVEQEGRVVRARNLDEPRVVVMNDD
jgi:hypothetical protein